MVKMHEATVKKASKSKPQGTTVSFIPDLKRFGMDKLDDDIVAVIKRRVVDFAATTGMRTTFNGQRINVKNFRDYVRLYVDDSRVFVYEMGRWQVALCPSTEGFQHISFVNNIFTGRGGTHVKEVLGPFEKYIVDEIKKRRNGLTGKVSSRMIREHCMLFVNCLIENPAFDTQTKMYLTLNPKKFGSEFEFDKSAMKKIASSGILDSLEEALLQKSQKALSKYDGKKKNKIHGIPKLDDANWAGTKKSPDCTLILTEGDSAKALAVAGLSVVGRNAFGVFPLKGKLINASKKKTQVLVNTEVQNLVKILGLKVGHVYTSTQELRYGHVMIMADQDVDGSHIKGLLIHLFQTLWPSLLKIGRFMQQFITPIIRVSKRNESKDFFSTGSFNSWKDEVGKEIGLSYKVKYYKGLGTSTSKDARDYFTNLDKHRLEFAESTVDDIERLEVAFGNDSTPRKDWINNYIESGLNANPQWNGKIKYKDFVNDELVIYAWDSVLRSVPSIYDGLKPGQRKVIYAMLNITDKERKVSQLMGIVSEQTNYHHGEASLGQSIIRMAQTFCGKNNLNLLKPNGQFGSRAAGGSDCADARYIFTQLDPVAKALFRAEDNILLERVMEDGLESECKNFYPVLPLVLINGSQGIAMGWRCLIPPHDPHQLVQAITDMLDGKFCPKLHVHYKGYNGKVNEVEKGKVRVDGIITRTDIKELTITELPVGTWTQDYVVFLEALLQNGKINHYQQFHTEHVVKFVITTTDEIAGMEEEKLFTLFKLRKELTSSLVLFDTSGALRTYSSTEDICSDFFIARLSLYEQRRLKVIELSEADIIGKENVIRFIQAINDDRIIVRDVEVATVEEQLQVEGYINIDRLLDLSIKSTTSDRLRHLQRECKTRAKELEEIKTLTAADLWRRDLTQFVNALVKWEKSWEKERLEDRNAKKPNSKGKKRKRVVKKINVSSE